MGPPGGGRNDITSRFTRHLQICSIDEFDESTMTRIFTSISDWHFSKGFDGSFMRLGKVNLFTHLNYIYFYRQLQFVLMIRIQDGILLYISSLY